MSWTSAVRSLLELGAANVAEGDREGILVANVAACVIVVTTTSFALIYALYGEPSLIPLVYANLALAVAAAMTPLFHRFGRVASGLWEFGICVVVLVWIASYVGRDSGVLLTLLGVTPVAFAILGFQNIALVTVLSAMAAITVIAASIAFPQARSGVYDDTRFLQLLHSSSIITLTLMCFATILAAATGVEKIKTIGDAYLAVAGVPARHPTPEKAAAVFGFGAIAAAREIGERHGVVLKLRAGMASGSVTAGVLGRAKYAYDIWGAPVNLAARLEAIGKPGCITTTAEIRQRLGESFLFICSGREDIKGFGPTEIWTTRMLDPDACAPGIRAHTAT
ncbi:adenylate/guanylate cyclase domain-containing protein [Hyphomicrobiales bacterium]|uniref:adenylate/guanylate cyclase domain-containing protein n=1 Tax=Ensifer adhaerens TaxID=106592 RepID=UPI000DE24067